MTASLTRPLLLCFTHLRWDFVWQRPQHLLSRASEDYRVVVFEEPLWRSGASSHLDVRMTREGITVVVPIVPEGTTAEDAVEVQRDLLDELMVSLDDGRVRIFWYYTPMALAFSGHMKPDVVVYDNMDELSAFRFASPTLLAMEDELFHRADIVFTGGLSLYEAKKHRHRRVHAYPSSIDFAHFSAARAEQQ